MDVFIDEAGDLGFSGQSSNVFVVAYTMPNQPELIRTALKRLMKKINQRHAKNINEFRFSKDKPYIRNKVLQVIAKQQFDLGYVIIDKRSVNQQLRNDPPRLYRYIVVNYVITSLVKNYDLKEIRLVVDKSLTGDSQKFFNNYAEKKLLWRQVFENGKNMPKLEVKHLDSRNDTCIQMADYCSGVAFAKFEHGNETYFNLLKNKIKFKNSWGNIKW